jgi:tetratricopeptide (TPR) repeat protein
MGRAALANNRGWTSQFGEVDRDRISILKRAIELDGLANPARCAQLISLQAMEMQFDLDHGQRRALADEALALAREVGDEAVLASVMWEWFQAHWAPDTLEARGAITRELSALAERLDDPLAEVWAAVSTLNCAAEAGETETAQAAAARFRAVAERVGHLGLLWHVSYHEAGLALVRGELDAAETLADSAARLGDEVGQPDALVVYAGQISEVRWLQGRLDEVIDLLEQSAADTTAIPGFRAGLAAALGRLGRIDEAAAIVRQGVRDGFAHVPRDQVYLTTLALYAEGASSAGDREAAEMLYDLIEPWSEQTVWNGAMGWGPAHGYLGLLASTLKREERAEEHFAASSERAESAGMPIWAAKSHADWARALAQRGDASRARTEAERALELAISHGYGFVERDARTVLASLQSAPR